MERLVAFESAGGVVMRDAFGGESVQLRERCDPSKRVAQPLGFGHSTAVGHELRPHGLHGVEFTALPLDLGGTMPVNVAPNLLQGRRGEMRAGRQVMFDLAKDPR